ncbi:MAG: hypothetical protein ACI976_002692 [Aureispira sp.]|jgi:hypothetical protein
MKNKDFDNIDKLAQNAFENFEVEFDPMDWADLQSKLRTETSIDRVAKDALEDYKVPFDKKDWIRLEKQLDKERDLVPHIWWLKSAEAGVMALLLFTIFNVTSSNQPPHTHSTENYDRTTTLTPSSIFDNTTTKDKNSTFQIQEKDAATPTSETGEPQAFNEQANTNSSNPTILANASSDNNSNNNSFKTNQLATASKPNRSNSTAVTNTTTDDKRTSTVLTTRFKGNEIPNQTNDNGFTGKDGTANTLSTTTKYATNNLQGIENAAAENNATEENNTLAKNNATEKGLAIQEDNTTTENNAIQENVAIRKVGEDITRSLFSVLQISTLDVKEGIKTTDPIFELKRAKLELPFRGKNYVGAIASIGSNFATNMGGTSIGYGAGLTFTSEFSHKISLKTGAIIAYNKYDLNEVLLIDKIDGNTQEINQSKTSHLVIIEIPLDVQYTFFQSDQWKIYGTAGIVANIISSRTYTGTQLSATNGISLKEDLNSNNFERGAFEGGKLGQNAFLSIGGGLGLERQLGDKISLYILPTYRHGITPSGAGKDHISSFSVNIGIKTAL